VTAKEFRPTKVELRISKRILLHMAGQPRADPIDLVSIRSLTQEGMAEALGTTQGAVSNALRRLVDGGALEVGRRHVPGKARRVKVYGLTARGEEIVRVIREGPRS
jgi:DNA-binding MarR family transcriptional regulator